MLQQKCNKDKCKKSLMQKSIATYRNPNFSVQDPSIHHLHTSDKYHNFYHMMQLC